MKLVKFYTILTYYVLIFSVLYLFLDISIFNLMKAHLYLILIFVIYEMLIMIKIFYELFKHAIIAYSLLIMQVIILLFLVYLLDYSGIYLIINLFTTILLVYLLLEIHQKKLVSNPHSYNHLIIRNNFLLTVIYIGYGVSCYVTFIMSHPHFLDVFNNMEDMSYSLFSPYLLIMLLLYQMRYDHKTDVFNTQFKYTKGNMKLIIRKNFLLNVISLLFIFI